MTDYKFGDIVIAKVPFTDFSTQKKRPIVIVNHDILLNLKGDVLFLPVSSRISNAKADLSEFFITNVELSGLPKPSYVKASIFTLQATSIEKKLGSLGQQDQESLYKLISTILRTGANHA